MNEDFIQAVFGEGGAPEPPQIYSPVRRVMSAVYRAIVPDRIREFLQATSGPRCSDDTYASRLAICESNHCGSLIQKEGKLYCGACGCPNWHLAELHTKLRFANLQCPKEPPLWGRANV